MLSLMQKRGGGGSDKSITAKAATQKLTTMFSYQWGISRVYALTAWLSGAIGKTAFSVNIPIVTSGWITFAIAAIPVTNRGPGRLQKLFASSAYTRLLRTAGMLFHSAGSAIERYSSRDCSAVYPQGAISKISGAALITSSSETRNDGVPGLPKTSSPP